MTSKRTGMFLRSGEFEVAPEAAYGAGGGVRRIACFHKGKLVNEPGLATVVFYGCIYADPHSDNPEATISAVERWDNGLFVQRWIRPADTDHDAYAFFTEVIGLNKGLSFEPLVEPVVRVTHTDGSPYEEGVWNFFSFAGCIGDIDYQLELLAAACEAYYLGLDADVTLQTLAAPPPDYLLHWKVEGLRLVDWEGKYGSSD